MLLSFINTDCFICIISFINPICLSYLSMVSKNLRDTLKDVLRYTPTFKKRIFLLGGLYPIYFKNTRKTNTSSVISNNFLFTNKFTCNNIWIFSYIINNDFSIIFPSLSKLIIKDCFISEGLKLNYEQMTFLSITDVINWRYLFYENVVMDKMEHFSLINNGEIRSPIEDVMAINKIICLLPKSMSSIRISIHFCTEELIEKLSLMKENYFEDCSLSYIY